MSVLDIREFETVRAAILTRDQRDGLLASSAQCAVSPEPGAGELWQITAGSHVGFIALPGMTVRIRPKLPVSSLFAMVSAAIGTLRWDDRGVDVGVGLELEDIIALALCRAVRTELKRGLLRGFVGREEESSAVRGRLRLRQTVERRPASFVPFVQETNALDVNIPENRLLATALGALRERVHSEAVRREILACQAALRGVAEFDLRRPLPAVIQTRLNTRWWEALELAGLIVRSSGLDHSGGGRSSIAFLADMNLVFERFLHRSLASSLSDTGLALLAGRGGLHLDRDRRHALKPDLSVWRGDRCLFCGDAKYKCLSRGEARAADVYQATAYAVAAGLSEAMLVYGDAVESDHDLRVGGADITVRVRTIDLRLPPANLRARVDALAAQIRDAVRRAERGAVGSPRRLVAGVA